MANKVMEQKTLKMKRMRRAWNRYGNIKSGAIPNRIVLDQYKMSARGLDGSSERIADTLALGFKGIPPGRVEALRRQAELEAQMPVCDLKRSGPGPSNSFQHSDIYFNSRLDQFLIVYEDRKKMVRKRSIVYCSMQILVTAWNQGKVVWVSCADLPPKKS